MSGVVAQVHRGPADRVHRGASAARRIVRGLVCAAAAAFALVAWGQPPEAAQYRRALTAAARVVWGLDAPIATFAAQVHQESGWRPDARSRYAAGLAQFTPATADWISARYASELGENQPLNPSWALRALVRYDRHLWDRVLATDECSRAAMMLAAYNGGLGHVLREQRVAAEYGVDPGKWFYGVERYCLRASWACRENRDYPRKILLRWQPLYSTWGPGISCAGVT